MANGNILETINAQIGSDKKMDKLRDSSELPIAEEEGRISIASPLVADIRAKLDESERARQTYERQWMKNVNSYRGNDSADNVMRQSEKSKVYVRTTTVKVKAAYAQIIEALFAEPKFPISISDTRIPEGVSEYAHLKTDMDADVARETPEEPTPLGGIGFEGDEFEVKPGSTQSNLDFLGGMKDEMTDEQGESVIMEGRSFDPNGVQLSPSKELARRMEKVIHDQLEETKARTEVRKAVFEMCLLGTGVMKGPFNVNKTLHKWRDGQYAPETRKTCKSSMVSTWNFYPDPNATTADEMEWAIERHKMNHAQLRGLRDRPHFDRNAIKRLLDKPGNYTRKSFEHTLDETNYTESEARLYEVLEYWGFVSVDFLEEYEIDYDRSSLTGDMVQINAWVSGNEVLRVVVNPFIPQRIPYFVVPYEVDPYSTWGTGVPESMEDTQALMNGFMRLAVDNLALSGNLVFDVDESMLVPGQPMEIQPGQIFRRQAGGVGQAIHGIQFPNTAPANMDMYRQVRQMADESTGIPSFAHGQMGVMSPTRTASGMSMLLNNASLQNKTVIRNIDDFLLKPWGEAYYRWNMQFNEDVTIKGDLEIKACGSSSMQAKEVRSTRLNTFIQLAANPALAPLIKFPTVIRELAITMDMDPEEILNSPEEQQIYAALMGTQNMQQPAGAPPAPSPDGIAAPGAPGFTGNAEGAGNELGANGQEALSGLAEQMPTGA